MELEKKQNKDKENDREYDKFVIQDFENLLVKKNQKIQDFTEKKLENAKAKFFYGQIAANFLYNNNMDPGPQD